MTDAINQFEVNPALFLEKAIKEFVATSPSNRLPAFDNDPIFDEPLVGFSNGDDPIFSVYKKEEVIGPLHYTPREILEKHIAQKNGENGKKPAYTSVVSYILPITYKTRLSQRRETQVASARWNHTRWQGQAFINELSLYLVSLLEKLGHQAIAPEQSSFYQVSQSTIGLRANWSQRHIAYAAGLGTFSLNDGFITRKGIAMRCGSVVCDAEIAPTPRLQNDHRANCLFYRGGSCQRCQERCPIGAITPKGHDKERCRSFLSTEQWKLLKELGREGEHNLGKYVACGLCQTKVPCEARIPPAPSHEIGQSAGR